MESATITSKNSSKGIISTVLFGLVGFLIFGIMIVWLQRMVPPPDPVAERAGERWRLLEQTRRAESAALNDILWVDKEAGLVSVPPSMLRDQVLAELKAKPVVASNVPVDPLAALPSLEATKEPATVPEPALDTVSDADLNMPSDSQPPGPEVLK